VQRLIVFGGLSIATEAGALTGRAVQRRRLALLALLAVARHRGMSRDKLIALLWPGADAEAGRHYLSDSVYRINSAMGGDIIVTSGDDLRLDSEHLPTDLADFEDALARRDHEGAVSLYGGPFLDGFFLSDAPELERWIDGERARLAAAFARSLEALAEAAALRGEPAVAVSWWRRLAAHDPYNSRVALRLMHAMCDAGERAAAIQHARVHETLLKGELELDPDPAIAELAERLRTEKQPESKPVPAEPSSTLPHPQTTADGVRAPSGTSVARENLPAPPRSPRRRRLLRGIVAGAVAVGLTAAWLNSRAEIDAAPNTSGVAMRSVAVLPFANLSVDAENEYFSDGMTEELITTLGTVEGLAVASRTSVFAYKNRALDIREIGRKLGVDAVVEGSVRKSGRRLRITAQLVSTANGYRVWSAAYDREVDDVFAIQEEIARSIVTRMSGALAGSAATASPERSTRDSEAYDLYLRGRFAWHQRTKDGLERAIDYLQRAVDRAPMYARAHAGLGDAYAVSAFYDYRAPRDAYPKAEMSARRALEIDPLLAAPHATLGYILTYYHLDWPQAEAEFQRALAMEPNYSTAHQWYANLLTVAGRFDEAARAMRRAQEADPLSLIANAALGWTLFYAGDYSAALKQCRSTLALDPNYVLAHLWGGWALEALGQSREAREWIGRAIEIAPGNELTRLSLAHLLAGAPSDAERDSARMILRDIEGRSLAGTYVPSYEIAKVYLALGERAEALRWLERAVDERSHSRAFLRVDPQLGAIRGDAQYERLVDQAVPSIVASRQR
jgi:TolB-like protein/DNA-binding SARP family transcriptional activator/Tfp pilus assembly protein PilF